MNAILSLHRLEYLNRVRFLGYVVYFVRNCVLQLRFDLDLVDGVEWIRRDGEVLVLGVLDLLHCGSEIVPLLSRYAVTDLSGGDRLGGGGSWKVGAEEQGVQQVEMTNLRRRLNMVIRNERVGGMVAWQENSCPDYNFSQRSSI